MLSYFVFKIILKLNRFASICRKIKPDVLCWRKLPSVLEKVTLVNTLFHLAEAGSTERKFYFIFCQDKVQMSHLYLFKKPTTKLIDMSLFFALSGA